MTPQQYAYLERRWKLSLYSQMLHNGNLGNKIPAGFGEKTLNLKAIDIETGHSPFLFYAESDGNYDIMEQNKAYEKYRWIPGQPVSEMMPGSKSGNCSSFVASSIHARNYDWTYDDASEIVFRIPAGVDKSGSVRHASLNVARLNVSNKSLTDGENPWKSEFDLLECSTMDGVNDCGISINVNVVPAGDNPKYPQGIPAAITDPVIKYNITYDTNPGKRPLFIRCMLRMILDYCESLDDAEKLILNNSWFAARNAAESFVEEFHVMISDAKGGVLLVEFVENRPVFHKWQNGIYLGCSDERLKIGYQENVRPIMTNFYISSWNGLVDNIGMNFPVADRNISLTGHSNGTERYQELNAGFESVSDAESAKTLLEKAWYRKTYRAGEDGRAPVEIESNTAWWSEFTGKYPEPLGDFTLCGTDAQKEILVKYMTSNVGPIAQAAKEEHDFETSDVRPKSSSTWQTVHSSVYDKSGSECKLLLRVQEDASRTYEFVLLKSI